MFRKIHSSVHVSQSLWEKITSQLNKVPTGTQKDWKKWRKTWQDLKKGAKAKDAAIRKHSRQTGGGPPTSMQLTEVDNEVLQLIPDVQKREVDYEVEEIFDLNEDINVVHPLSEGTIEISTSTEEVVAEEQVKY
ncbi:uncharacterized protein LOC123673797 [Harmonia axyridis]|uniref:uncharacterized protein LOC123673797 n=1 Tax=Harmonia axyridis TaxID=115357 RepID=UPI001E276B06|nr:uncharacterized protein LOC123673797 [Harmonia axyridis]